MRLTDLARPAWVARIYASIALCDRNTANGTSLPF